jgi:acetate---CoA ligase (ADP-forming)
MRFSKDDTLEAIRKIFYTDSVAVVGASNNPHKYGYMTIDTLIRGGYSGRIYPVNPKAGEILGLKVYSSLADLPEVPALGVVMVPYEFILSVVSEAVAIGMSGLVITTSGFAEAGRTDLQNELYRIATEGNLRIIGPNTEGFIYTHNKLHAQYYPVIKNSGSLAIITQSGSLSNSLIGWANDEAVGISACISLGNQIDLRETDFISYLADDENTSAIALHLEGLAYGRKFLQMLSEVACKKPIVILKAGRSATGSKSVASHTASLAGSNHVFKAVCRQFGVSIAEDIQSLYDFGKVLAMMKIPRGNRLVVISSSGGLGILAVDEAESIGLTVPQIPPSVVERLRALEFANPLGSMDNPIDLATIWINEFIQVALLLDNYDLADLILFNFGDPIPDAGEKLAELSRKLKASLIVSYMGGEEDEKKDKLLLHQAGIPVMQTPERAVRAAAAAVRFGKIQGEMKSRQTALYDFPGKDEESEELNPVAEPAAVELLAKYNIPYPEHGLAISAAEAVELAEKIGYPVVLKLVSPQVLHKSDIGGVAVNLSDAGQVLSSYERLVRNVSAVVEEAEISGILVCKQADQGVEVIAGAVDDPVFGPTIMFGLGGIFTEVLEDVAFRVAPLRLNDAEKMIREIRGYPLLEGARGGKPCALRALVELLLNLSRMIIENPEIKELDLNPVRVYEKDLMALDVKMLLRERRD